MPGRASVTRVCHGPAPRGAAGCRRRGRAGASPRRRRPPVGAGPGARPSHRGSGRRAGPPPARSPSRGPAPPARRHPPPGSPRRPGAGRQAAGGPRGSGRRPIAGRRRTARPGPTRRSTVAATPAASPTTAAPVARRSARYGIHVRVANPPPSCRRRPARATAARTRLVLPMPASPMTAVGRSCAIASASAERTPSRPTSAWLASSTAASCRVGVVARTNDDARCARAELLGETAPEGAGAAGGRGQGPWGAAARRRPVSRRASPRRPRRSASSGWSRRGRAPG